jgi:catalase
METIARPQIAPDAFVDALNGIYGRHPGHRPLHARPIGDCTGRFVAALDAARLSRAVHFSGVPIPAAVRFSAESGAPRDADAANDDKGRAVQFNLPDGATTEIVARRTPVAMASTPASFLAFLQAVRADPATGNPDAATVAAMVAAHPDVRPFLAAHDALTPLSSVAAGRYFAVHTFRLINAQGESQPGRYIWEPEEENGPAPAIPEGDRDFYARELHERLGAGPVVFHLRFQLPEAGDDLDDPTVAWPQSRPVVTLGRLEVTSLVTGNPNPVEAVVYNPTNFTDGVAASDDPVLAVRQAVYERSYARRATT